MLKISFCIPCMDRLDHIKETIFTNLIDVQNSNAELILLDYNSKDGLGNWVKNNLLQYIESGKLVYYRTEEPEYFHMSHAKNVSHKLATGDLLCNLDADNYITPGFVEYLNNECLGHKDKLVFGKGASRLFGKIALFRDDFINVLYGYSEGFSNYGYEDRDLFERAKKCGFKKIFYGDKYFKRIEHSSEQSVNNFMCKNTIISSEINKSLYKYNMKNKIIRTNLGDWGKAKVIKNFKEEIIL
jgi:predicted glycosyltransferase involved in capsule biosynthesis